MIVNSTIQRQSPLPIVATPTTSSTPPQLSTTTKAWPPAPQPPPPPPSATTKPLFDHTTTFRPDHPPANMLGLHNILLIAPSSSSCHHHHHHHHNIHEPFNNNNNNNNSSNNLNEPSFWSLKRRQESGNNRDNNGDDNDEEDDHHSLMKVCRDCGNRAKKECSFSRCRTCCKTRGYDCATHVRSTWVPTAKRREKKLSVDCSVGGGCGGGSSGSSSCAVKRPRAALSSENVTATTSSSFNAPPTLCFTGSVPQDASFKKSLPSQVKAPAVFRCISVTAINDGEADEVAYVATTNISGHVFKGFLYDQGIDEKNLFPCISKMQTEASTSVKNRDSSSVDPSTTFAASAT